MKLLGSGGTILLIMVLLYGCVTPGPTLSPEAPGLPVKQNPNETASPTPFSPFNETDTQILQAASNLAELPASTPTPTITPYAAIVFIPATYILNVTLDYAGHALSVDETINYPNSSGAALDNLVLAIEPNLWHACFVAGSTTVNGQLVEVSLNGDRLEIPLDTPLAADASLEFYIHYDLHLPAADVYHVFGYNDRQENLINWYPFIVPFVPGNGWLLHAPASVGEHLVYDTQILKMTLHLTDPHLNVVVAASSPAEAIPYGWYYHLDNVRSFALSISPDYLTSSSEVNGVSVTSYYFDGEQAQGQVILGEVEKALTTFDSLFGSDPYPSLNIVESPFFDGLEFDGLFFLSRDFYISENGTLLNDLIDIAVHETAHQWWYGSVGNDQALDPWLDEALATFSERIFYEQNYPKVTAWQAFRIDAYHPSGWVDSDIYSHANSRAYTDAVYLRGVQFLQALRGHLGEVGFLAFLKDYATQMAGKRASTTDFFRILQEHDRSDLSDLIKAYFQYLH